MKKQKPAAVDISAFDSCNILVVGDLMIDEYIWGDVNRISPEAPVPIVLVKSESYTLGGSGNVINNIVSLGGTVLAAGVIGTGRNGKRLLNRFAQLGVATDGIIQDSERPTTRKTRVIATNQHVLRIDRESRTEISNKTHNRLCNFLNKTIPKADLVLISDYGKGLVSNSLLSYTIQTATSHGKMTIADPKGFNFSKYAGVSLLTPNKKETGIAAGLEIVDEAALREAGNKILDSVDIGRLLITLGKDGMILFERGKKPLKIQAEARQVYDVSGAGDTVLAVLGLGLAAGASLEEAMRLANTAAGIVVGKVGTATVSKEELMNAVKMRQKRRSD
ncbi:MAG: D-glycero-beta-D-manno-heptose-7-phosphate kinase [Pseudomonadota bacterium]